MGPFIREYSGSLLALWIRLLQSETSLIHLLRKKGESKVVEHEVRMFTSHRLRHSCARASR